MAPVVYLTDLTFADYDPADLFDLAFLLRSDRHDLAAVCLAAPEGDGARVVAALAARASGAAPTAGGREGLRGMLEAATEPVSLVAVGGYALLAELLATDRALVREKTARIFLVGGHANDYRGGAQSLPIDPRLKERHPERFSPAGDPRVPDPGAFSRILTSGEGVIWLPRDICLWRYAAPGILEIGGGELAWFLVRELLAWNLARCDDRYEAADAPALLSALPALLLAAAPDPTLWLRLFRALPARVEMDAAGRVVAIDPAAAPNVYAVVAIDGRALGKLLTERLRE